MLKIIIICLVIYVIASILLITLSACKAASRETPSIMTDEVIDIISTDLITEKDTELFLNNNKN